MASIGAMPRHAFGARPGEDGRHRIPLLQQYFLIATENLIDAGDPSVQNPWIARGALAGCVMEHRGVRYELRRALGNDEWVWTVYTPAPKQGYVSGDRYFAMQRAMSVIDRWCGRNAESVPPQASQEATWGGMNACQDADRPRLRGRPEPGASYLSFSAMLRCSLRCGSVLNAQPFSSALSPPLA